MEKIKLKSITPQGPEEDPEEDPEENNRNNLSAGTRLCKWIINKPFLSVPLCLCLLAGGAAGITGLAFAIGLSIKNKNSTQQSEQKNTTTNRPPILQVNKNATFYFTNQTNIDTFVVKNQVEHKVFEIENLNIDKQTGCKINTDNMKTNDNYTSNVYEKNIFSSLTIQTNNNIQETIIITKENDSIIAKSATKAEAESAKKLQVCGGTINKFKYDKKNK